MGFFPTPLQAVSLLTFEDGLNYVTGGLAPSEIRWSGGNGETSVPLSGSTWLSSPFYNDGYLLGPSGNVDDSFIWLYDTVNGFPEYFEVTAGTVSDSTQGISYDFINSVDNRGQTPQNAGYADVALSSADRSLFLVANVVTIIAPQTNVWNTVTASYDVTKTVWYVGSLGGSVATQEQVNSIINSSSWFVRFGYENIEAFVGPTGPEFMAVDNLSIGAEFVPEPSSILMSALGIFLAVGFRRR